MAYQPHGKGQEERGKGERIMDMVTQQRIAENIRYLRIFRGYTQNEMAEYLQIARSSYHYIEAGKKPPRADVLVQLTSLYDLEIEVLLEQDREQFMRKVVHAYGKDQRTQTLENIYLKLSPFARGCLVERARMLLEEQEQEFLHTSADER
jgi:transcriptional regulator with XRE-family HTH domain